MTTQLRDAVDTDDEAVARIYVASWNDGFVGLMPARGLTAAEVARWRAALVSAPVRWRVAVADQAVVGFAGIGPSRDPVEEGLGELDTIAVDPQHWRTGVGSLLMADALTALTASYRTAILWTLTDYPRGEAFYRRAGWVPDGRTRSEGRQVSFRHPLTEAISSPR